jgi:hypothetical protein
MISAFSAAFERAVALKTSDPDKTINFVSAIVVAQWSQLRLVVCPL